MGIGFTIVFQYVEGLGKGEGIFEGFHEGGGNVTSVLLEGFEGGREGINLL